MSGDPVASEVVGALRGHVVALDDAVVDLACRQGAGHGAADTAGADDEHRDRGQQAPEESFP